MHDRQVMLQMWICSSRKAEVYLEVEERSFTCSRLQGCQASSWLDF
jgi:hypothetical protein